MLFLFFLRVRLTNPNHSGRVPSFLPSLPWLGGARIDDRIDARIDPSWWVLLLHAKASLGALGGAFMRGATIKSVDTIQRFIGKSYITE